MKKWIYQNVNTLTLITFIFLISGLLLKWTDVQSFSNAFLIIATLIAMMPIALKAWQSLMLKVFSIELLVTLAVIGALYIHEYTESAVVTFLFLFGSYLEARTLKITRNSISKLVDMAPQDANRLRDGEIEKSILTILILVTQSSYILAGLCQWMVISLKERLILLKHP